VWGLWGCGVGKEVWCVKCDVRSVVKCREPSSVGSGRH
jgi:hypothetical protein